MKHGYVKAAALTPGIRVADTVYNTEQIKKGLDEAFAEAAKIIVFPELCITGYTCQDLVFQETLLKGATEGLKEIREYTRGRDALVFVGLPLEKSGKLFNVAAVLQNGKILAFIPKETISFSVWMRWTGCRLPVKSVRMCGRRKHLPPPMRWPERP